MNYFSAGIQTMKCTYSIKRVAFVTVNAAGVIFQTYESEEQVTVSFKSPFR